MAKSNFFFVSGLIACFLSLALVADSHVGGKRLGDPSAASKIEDIALHERSDFYENETNLEHTLLKRGEFFLDAVAPDDANILHQAFTDMVDVVTYVSQNPNPLVLNRYFTAADQNAVTAIFDTVRQMAQVGGFPNPLRTLHPTDLNQIHVTRPKGVGLTLAESFNIEATGAGERIAVYDFGWGALWKKRRSDVKCDCDIKKTNYKMHFLGTLLLHEVLYVSPASIHSLRHVQTTLLSYLSSLAILTASPTSLGPSKCPSTARMLPLATVWSLTMIQGNSKNSGTC